MNMNLNKILILFTFALGSSCLMAQESTSLNEHYVQITPVQTQLDAYNTGNLELFLSAYSDSVKVYNYPDEFRYQGKEKMRKVYGNMFENLSELHCRLVSRMVMGNKVIDQEFVTFSKEGKPVHVVAIYTVKDGKIIEVRFMH